MNKKHYILFIVKNISCVQFSSCPTSDENFLASNFFQTTVTKSWATSLQDMGHSLNSISVI